MAAKFERSPRVLGPREQGAYLRLVWPRLHVSVSGGRVVASGDFGSVSWTRPYVGRVVYEVGHTPQTFIDDPPLEKRNDGHAIPHVYDDNEPCSFNPKKDWSPDLPIAMTVVPWLMTWLVFYEGWRATGVWDGGGLHPPSNDP